MLTTLLCLENSHPTSCCLVELPKADMALFHLFNSLDLPSFAIELYSRFQFQFSNFALPLLYCSYYNNRRSYDGLMLSVLAFCVYW